MLIELSYDLLVELHFLSTGRYPLALRNMIRSQKVQIYQGLGQDLRRPDMLSGTAVFQVGNRSFEVSFASDRTRDDPANDIRQLRVLEIDELP